MVTSTTNHDQQDDIRDYIEYLEPSNVKERKYYCPICGGNDLTIGKGGFKCWTNKCEGIYQALKKKAGKWTENYSGYKSKNKKTKAAKPKLKKQPVAINLEQIKIATFLYFPTNIPRPQKPHWTPDWLIKNSKN